jgi:hypothetical protein
MQTTEAPLKLKQIYSYEQYRDLISLLAENNESTGVSSEERIAATKLNAQRIKRIDKQCLLIPELQEALQNFTRRCEWILLVESWCGDGAQCIPVISKIAAGAAHVDLKLILRDTHPEIMDTYLTNGSRAIPKLICFDKDTHQEIGQWGPRPARIQEMVINFKQTHPGVSHDEFVKNLHLWYAKDQPMHCRKNLPLC